MPRVNLLIVFGLLIMLDPFSGLPIGFRTLLQVVFGAVVLAIALSLRAEETRKLHTAHEAPAPIEPPSTPEPPSTISPI